MPDESLEPERTPVTAVQPAPAPEVTAEERLEQAKTLYVQAETQASEGNWVAALALYEQAYYLVPDKHGFALKVGQAAEQTGDCTNAIAYYEHFVKYAEGDKYAEAIASTKEALAALQSSGC